MTVNEQIKEILEIHRKSVDWKKEAPTFNDYRANKIISLFQPKTTSTDIEKLKKEFNLMLDKALGYYESDGSNITDEGTRNIIWEWFASHPSNKSELKKEAVREFGEYYLANRKDALNNTPPENIWARNIVMEMQTFEKVLKQYLSSDEKGGKWK